MKAIPNREWKFDYLFIHQKGKCGCGCGMPLDYSDTIDMHHMCHDNKHTRGKYAKSIHTTFNLRLVRHNHHISYAPGSLPFHSDRYMKRLELRLLNPNNHITRYIATGIKSKSILAA